MFNYYDIPFNFNYDNLDDTKIAHFVDHVQKKYITHWKHSLCNSQKLEFYDVFKDSYTPSIYLEVTRKNPNRKTLVKLRISNHKLNIETDRYDKISRFDRICPVWSRGSEHPRRNLLTVSFCYVMLLFNFTLCLSLIYTVYYAFPVLQNIPHKNTSKCKILIVPEEGWLGQPKYSMYTFKKHSTLCRFLLLFSSFYTRTRLDHYWSNVYQQDHLSGNIFCFLWSPQ